MNQFDIGCLLNWPSPVFCRNLGTTFRYETNGNWYGKISCVKYTLSIPQRFPAFFWWYRRSWAAIHLGNFTSKRKMQQNRTRNKHKEDANASCNHSLPSTKRLLGAFLPVGFNQFLKVQRLPIVASPWAETCPFRNYSHAMDRIRKLPTRRIASNHLVKQKWDDADKARTAQHVWVCHLLGGGFYDLEVLQGSQLQSSCPKESKVKMVKIFVAPFRCTCCPILDPKYSLEGHCDSDRPLQSISFPWSTKGGNRNNPGWQGRHAKTTTGACGHSLEISTRYGSLQSRKGHKWK